MIEMALENPTIQSDQSETPNPYQLTEEKLTMPDGNRLERLAWLRDVISIQREGNALGIRPQSPILPYDVSIAYRGIWRRQVWNHYLKTQHTGHSLGIQPGGQTHNKKYIAPD